MIFFEMSCIVSIKCLEAECQLPFNTAGALVGGVQCESKVLDLLRQSVHYSLYLQYSLYIQAGIRPGVEYNLQTVTTRQTGTLIHRCRMSTLCTLLP